MSDTTTAAPVAAPVAAAAGPADQQTSEQVATLTEAPIKFPNERPSTKWQYWDPKHPPLSEMDCFGKYHLEGDPACYGDPNDPSDPGCLMRQECKIRTGALNQQIARSQSAENPRREMRFGKPTWTDVQEKGRIDGLELKGIEEKGAVTGFEYLKDGNRVLAVLFNFKKKELYGWAVKPFAGSTPNGKGKHEGGIKTTEELISAAKAQL